MEWLVYESASREGENKKIFLRAEFDDCWVSPTVGLSTSY